MARLAFLSTIALSCVAATARADDVVRLPVVFHVATADGAPVVTDRQLDRYLELANAYFADADLRLVRVEVRYLPPGHAHLETIRDRRQLARRTVRRTINVFVVDEILDPVPSQATRRAADRVGREPSGRLGGAHVRVRGRVPDTYIIVSRRTHDLVVTHEVGHFLGAPHHADPRNIMSYGAVRDRFDERQLRVFRLFARRHLRSGTLRSADPATSP